MDEAVFGGMRKRQWGWRTTDKHIVFGIYKRNGKVITFPIATHTFAAIGPLVAKHTDLDSLYYTDDWIAYGFLPIRKNHVVVLKEKGRPKGRDHINGIEGFWSYAKHWLYQYRGVPKQNFHLFLKEIEWRFNHREENLVLILRNLLNRQL